MYVTLSVALLLVEWICFCQSRVVTSKSTFDLGTTATSVNVTIAFERCFASSPQHVDTRITSGVSAPQLTAYIYNINALSFDATVVGATAWNQTTVTVKWRSYFKQVLKTQVYGSYYLYYEYLGQNITWSSARAFCRQQATRDLCNSTQICQNLTVLATGVTWGDDWTPIGDQFGDWLQIGDDNKNKAPRLCKRHTAIYKAVPSWGKVFGTCKRWNKLYNPCFFKGHVFCCKPPKIG